MILGSFLKLMVLPGNDFEPNDLKISQHSFIMFIIKEESMHANILLDLQEKMKS